MKTLEYAGRYVEDGRAEHVHHNLRLLAVVAGVGSSAGGVAIGPRVSCSADARRAPPAARMTR
jgi:hypothetical protein